MKTKEWMDFWLANCKKNTVKYHTYVQYRDIAALHLVPAFGEYGLNELTAERYRSFWRKSAGGEISERARGFRGEASICCSAC